MKQQIFKIIVLSEKRPKGHMLYNFMYKPYKMPTNLQKNGGFQGMSLGGKGGGFSGAYKETPEWS